MPVTIENLNAEDVSIIQNIYKKQTKGGMFLGLLFFILGLGAAFVPEFRTESFFLYFLGAIGLGSSYYSNNKAKAISANDIKERMTGLFCEDYSEKGQNRTLTLKIDDKEICYSYNWGLTAEGKKCGSFAGFIKGEDIAIEYFKMWGGGKIMLRTYDVNQKGEKVMNEKPEQALLKQAIAKDEQTLANLLKLMGFAIPFFLGMGFVLYTNGLLAGIETDLIFLAAGLYSFCALFGMFMINFIFKKQINEKRKLLDDYNPLNNSTR